MFFFNKSLQIVLLFVLTMKHTSKCRIQSLTLSAFYHHFLVHTLCFHPTPIPILVTSTVVTLPARSLEVPWQETRRAHASFDLSCIPCYLQTAYSHPQCLPINLVLRDFFFLESAVKNYLPPYRFLLLFCHA